MNSDRKNRTLGIKAAIGCNDAIGTEIDRILASEDELIPSSGFLVSVMQNIQEEARSEAMRPARVPFLRMRVFAGILLISATFGWGVFQVVHLSLPAFSVPGAMTILITQPLLFAAVARPLEDAGWVTLTLGVSLLCWLLPLRQARRSGLL